VKALGESGDEGESGAEDGARAVFKVGGACEGVFGDATPFDIGKESCGGFVVAAGEIGKLAFDAHSLYFSKASRPFTALLYGS
jgi:hypothetical protein